VDDRTTDPSGTEELAKACQRNRLPKAIVPTDLYGQSVALDTLAEALSPKVTTFDDPRQRRKPWAKLTVVEKAWQWRRRRDIVRSTATRSSPPQVGVCWVNAPIKHGETSAVPANAGARSAPH